MNFNQPTQQEFWDMLPLGDEQRKRIIEDFIKPGLYDRVKDEEVKDEEVEEVKEVEEKNN